MATVSKMPKRTSVKEITESKEPKSLDVFEILNKQYPATVGEYAVQVYYNYNKKNPKFAVQDHEILNTEEAILVIDGRKILVNIRNGSVKSV
jgi:hypothetical protein